MRIVTRPDFDGIVCAVLLLDAEDIQEDIFWVEPNEMQRGLVEIKNGDIVANLPFHVNASLWFDHHFTNKNNTNYKGLFRLAPSAAGLIYEYYDKKSFGRDYAELIHETDKIDSANLSEDEVNSPEKYPYILISMTISGRDKNDEEYWNKVVNLLRKHSIEDVLKDGEVADRCQKVINQNKKYKRLLKEYTKLVKNIAVTDFRDFDRSPQGNRFLVYSMFPETNVQVKISQHPHDHEKMIVSVGHSIFNTTCKVNIGLMLSNFEGGGHRGAGSCSFHKTKANEYIPKILNILENNQPNE